jgi:transposase, IS5 family
MTATERLLAQTDQRLAGNRVIPDRLVSLADPDARPIRKGKPGRPTEFGYTLLLAEDERRFIADHHLQRGNPPDAPQLVPAVQRVIAVTGQAPATVVGDRGFGTAANDQALDAMGSSGSGCNATAPPARRDRSTSGPGGSGGCATGGSGSRPASATSSVPSGCAARDCAA